MGLSCSWWFDSQSSGWPKICESVSLDVRVGPSVVVSCLTQEQMLYLNAQNKKTVISVSRVKWEVKSIHSNNLTFSSQNLLVCTNNKTQTDVDATSFHQDAINEFKNSTWKENCLLFEQSISRSHEHYPLHRSSSCSTLTAAGLEKTCTTIAFILIRPTVELFSSPAWTCGFKKNKRRIKENIS